MMPLAVRAELDSLASIRERVRTAAHEAGLTDADTYRLVLAVDEIATNIVTHGYVEAGRSGSIDLTTEIDEERLAVSLVDSGVEFDPTKAKDPDIELPVNQRAIGGMGVYLTIKSVDEFHYERSDNHNRNTFIMHRKHEAAPVPEPLRDDLGKRVLLLGKRGSGLDTIAAKLGRLGFGLDPVSEEKVALVKLEDCCYDALFVDAELAGADGLITRLRSVKNNGDPPVLLFSDAGADEPSAETDADDYISVSWSEATIRRRLSFSIEKKSLEAKLAAKAEELSGLKKLSEDFTKVILPIGIALSAEKNLDLLIEKIMLEAKGVCNADAGTLYLRREGDTLKFEIMYTDSLNIRMGGSSGVPIPFPPLSMCDPVTGEPNHFNVATHVALEGVSINIPDIYNSEGFDFTGAKAFDQMNGYRSTSILTVPLKNHENKVIGVIQLLNSIDPMTGAVQPFSDYVRRIVELLSSLAAIALGNQIMRHREQQLMKIEHDVQIGRKIQTDFLPDKLPQPPGCEVVSCFHPAREVSGDFYDAFMLPGTDHIGLVIADVCDKGVPAALFMAVIRSLIRAFSEQQIHIGTGPLEKKKPPKENTVEHKLMTHFADLNALNTVKTANEYIARTHSQLNMFATMFFGVLDPVTGFLTYINAGHEAPVIVGTKGIRTKLGQTGPAVGMMPESDFDLEQYQLVQGDILFMFTDGVPETRNAAGGFFTQKKLIELLGEPVDTAETLVKRIETALTAHIGEADQFDDITMLAVRWSPAL